MPSAGSEDVAVPFCGAVDPVDPVEGAPGGGIVTGTHPPKGPAFAELLHRTIHTLLIPATLPVHFWSAAILAVRG